MAATMTDCKFSRLKRFILSLGVSIVLGAMALYICIKIYIIRNEKDATQLDTSGGLLGAAYQYFSFILKSGNDKTDVFILDKEFYIRLWELIVLDAINIINALHYYLFLHHELNIFIFVTVILILIVLLIRKYIQWYPKSQEPSRSSKTRQKKNGRHEATYSQDSVGFCCDSHIERVKSRTKLYWWQLAVAVIGVSMLMSVPWEFVRLYKMKVAEKVTVVQSGIPPGCIPEQMTFQQMLHSWLHWLFSWDTDPCEKYHRSLLVDPLWEIPPLLVVTTAFVHCILHPIELLFSGMGRAFRLFFKEIPAQWQPIMLVVLMIFLLLFLVMLFDYGIHFPFLFKLELSSRYKKRNCVCKPRLNKSQNSQESIQGSIQDSLENN
ncbi:hypothetical protein ACJMK2_002265 [Sinanodonta woodiana]|uniref:Chloride channel CLIC-like protein 1 n=1 Tax=Sinanodonta woodiana TaxID=1069815 RepID=A0ABD3XWJ3_SINWO